MDTTGEAPQTPSEEAPSFKPPVPPLSKPDGAKLPEALVGATPAAVSTSAEGLLPYTAPSWACKPLEAEGTCRLEVIKNGAVIDNIPLANLDSTYLSVGRFK